MEEIYRSPESELDDQVPENEKEREIFNETKALKALYASQRIIWSPIFSTIGTMVIIVAMSFVEGRAPLLVFMLPAIVVGGVIKYVGKLIKIKHRMLSGLLVGGIVFFALYFSSPFMAGVIGLLNVLAFMAICRRPLTFEQEKLLSKESLGKLKP
ncbi:hypothetical protein SAMN02745866_01225 [Alteromonadaceae bacterium Bs31]|nr:hypothetical protein SAMN02745866_01225 [Alteromonadaceae bacterium Bs31]